MNLKKCYHINPDKNYGIHTLRECSVKFFFYIAVNKLITAVMQNIFYLIAEHSDFIKYSLDKLD